MAGSPRLLTMVINKSIDQIVLPDLYTPFYIIIGVFLLLGVIAYCSSLPEVKAAGEEEEEDNSNAEECEYANSKTSVFQFPHLLLGCLALFLYVGCETIALSTLVDYATNIGLPNPDMYAWISSIGMVIGYICGIIFIPKYISQDKAMIICAIVALIGSVAVVFTPKNFRSGLSSSSLWDARSCGRHCGLWL